MSKSKQGSSLPLIIIFFVVVVLLGVVFFLFFDNQSGGLLLQDDQGEAFEDILINEEENNMQQQTQPVQSVEDFEQLEYQIITESQGQQAVVGDTVSVHYTGSLSNGTVFDSSIPRDQPFEFTLGQGMVIQGWEEGVLGMKVGEKRVMRIPSSMGYGQTGAGEQIPPNAGLIFEVELLEIKQID